MAKSSLFLMGFGAVIVLFSLLVPLNLVDNANDLARWEVARSGSIALSTTEYVSPPSSVAWQTMWSIDVMTVLSYRPLQQDISSSPLLSVKIKPVGVPQWQWLGVAVTTYSGAFPYTWSTWTYPFSDAMMSITDGEWQTISVDLRVANEGAPDLHSVYAIDFSWYNANQPRPSDWVTYVDDLALIGESAPPSQPPSSGGSFNHTVTVLSGEGGFTSPSGSFSVADGATLTVTATAAVGFEFEHWLVNGQRKGDNPLALTVVEDVTVAPVFVESDDTSGTSGSASWRSFAMPFGFGFIFVGAVVEWKSRKRKQ